MQTERFASSLREHGLKSTPIRRRLLATLAQAKKPQNASQLKAKLKAYPATLYRVLDDLTTAGLIRQLDFREAGAYYELADPRDHHHLVCTNCQRIEGFTGCQIDEVTRTALRQTRQFSSVTSHALELFGLCRSCAQRQSVA